MLGEKHGLCNTRLYRIWHGIRKRCLNPSNHHYKDYGARGITLYDEWANSFMVFRDWALTHNYQEDLCIERIDNNAGYSPENCCWATPKQQAQNRRDTQPITAFGDTKCASEWVRDTRCVVSSRTFYRRIQQGWDVEVALCTPTYEKTG